jgi:antitoxin (DNA-binding transcriptional repressor) of toxin-antitoxin stability system
MKVIAAYGAKSRFSELLREAAAGEVFIITRNGQRMAELPACPPEVTARKRGMMKSGKQNVELHPQRFSACRGEHLKALVSKTLRAGKTCGSRYDGRVVALGTQPDGLSGRGNRAYEPLTVHARPRAFGPVFDFGARIGTTPAFRRGLGTQAHPRRVCKASRRHWRLHVVREKNGAAIWPQQTRSLTQSPTSAGVLPDPFPSRHRA